MFTFAKFCRLCSKNNHFLVSYFDEDFDNVTYYDKIKTILPPLVDGDCENFPTWICILCREELDQFYLFYEKCTNTHELLKKYRKQLRSLDPKTNSLKIENTAKIVNLHTLLDDSNDQESPLSLIDAEFIKKEKDVSELFDEDTILLNENSTDSNISIVKNEIPVTEEDEFNFKLFYKTVLHSETVPKASSKIDQYKNVNQTVEIKQQNIQHESSFLNNNNNIDQRLPQIISLRSIIEASLDKTNSSKSDINKYVSFGAPKDILEEEELKEKSQNIETCFDKSKESANKLFINIDVSSEDSKHTLEPKVKEKSQNIETYFDKSKESSNKLFINIDASSEHSKDTLEPEVKEKSQNIESYFDKSKESSNKLFINIDASSEDSKHTLEPEVEENSQNIDFTSYYSKESSNQSIIKIDLLPEDPQVILEPEVKEKSQNIETYIDKPKESSNKLFINIDASSEDSKDRLESEVKEKSQNIELTSDYTKESSNQSIINLDILFQDPKDSLEEDVTEKSQNIEFNSNTTKELSNQSVITIDLSPEDSQEILEPEVTKKSQNIFETSLNNTKESSNQSILNKNVSWFEALKIKLKDQIKKKPQNVTATSLFKSKKRTYQSLLTRHVSSVNLKDYSKQVTEKLQNPPARIPEETIVIDNEETDENPREETIGIYNEDTNENPREETIGIYDEETNENPREETIGIDNEETNENPREETIGIDNEETNENPREETIGIYDENSREETIGIDNKVTVENSREEPIGIDNEESDENSTEETRPILRKRRRAAPISYNEKSDNDDFSADDDDDSDFQPELEFVDTTIFSSPKKAKYTYENQKKLNHAKTVISNSAGKNGNLLNLTQSSINSPTNLTQTNNQINLIENSTKPLVPSTSFNLKSLLSNTTTRTKPTNIVKPLISSNMNFMNNVQRIEPTNNQIYNPANNLQSTSNSISSNVVPFVSTITSPFVTTIASPVSTITSPLVSTKTSPYFSNITLVDLSKIIPGAKTENNKQINSVITSTKTSSNPLSVNPNIIDLESNNSSIQPDNLINNISSSSVTNLTFVDLENTDNRISRETDKDNDLNTGLINAFKNKLQTKLNPEAEIENNKQINSVVSPNIISSKFAIPNVIDLETNNSSTQTIENTNISSPLVSNITFVDLENTDNRISHETDKENTLNTGLINAFKNKLQTKLNPEVEIENKQINSVVSPNKISSKFAIPNIIDLERNNSSTQTNENTNIFSRYITFVDLENTDNRISRETDKENTLNTGLINAFKNKLQTKLNPGAETENKQINSAVLSISKSVNQNIIDLETNNSSIQIDNISTPSVSNAILVDTDDQISHDKDKKIPLNTIINAFKNKLQTKLNLRAETEYNKQINAAASPNILSNLKSANLEIVDLDKNSSSTQTNNDNISSSLVLNSAIPSNSMSAKTNIVDNQINNNTSLLLLNLNSVNNRHVPRISNEKNSETNTAHKSKLDLDVETLDFDVETNKLDVNPVIAPSESIPSNSNIVDLESNNNAIETCSQIPDKTVNLISDYEDDDDDYFMEKNFCKDCNKNYKTAKDLEVHMEIHKKSPPNKNDTIHCCVYCYHPYPSRKRIMAHYKRAHLDVVNCVLCDKKFDTHDSLATHLYSHYDIDVLNCPKCDKLFLYSKQLYFHLQDVHKETTFNCFRCGKSFSTPKRAYNHMLDTHGSYGTYLCHVCGKKYFSQAKLNFHLESMHKNDDKIKHVCSYCGKQYSTSHTLRIHILSHHECGTYKCEICSKEFASHFRLHMHKRTHSESQKRFECGTCKKKFLHKFMLINHERTHTGDKPFKCKICDKAFSQEVSVNTHMRVHTGQKPFKCNICGKRYTQSYVYKMHMKKHERNTNLESDSSSD